MNWPYRHIIIVSEAEQATANAIAATIDPDEGGGNTFSVPLSSEGSEPATHYGCSTLSSQAMAEAMYAADTSDPPALASVSWWRLNSATGQLIDSNNEHGSEGQAWTWQNVLESLGLQVVRGDD